MAVGVCDALTLDLLTLALPADVRELWRLRSWDDIARIDQIARCARFVDFWTPHSDGTVMTLFSGR